MSDFKVNKKIVKNNTFCIFFKARGTHIEVIKEKVKDRKCM